MKKNIFFWILSFIIMLLLAIYQRQTGPTHPLSGSIKLSEQKVKFTLVRSWGENSDAQVKLIIPDSRVNGYLRYRRHPSYDEWSQKPLLRAGDTLVALIPQQPPAGKVMYQIVLQDENNNTYQIPQDGPVIIRFKGSVPSYFLFPHIFLMFFSMVFGIRTFLEAIFVKQNAYKLTFWTLILLMLGGVLFGPIVQYYAFGVFWSGWPFGQDLTDNKTLVSLIFWGIALWRLKKNPNDFKWPIIAALVMVAVYLIPHSLLGSEIDYRKVSP